jgi:hypothetical protein
MNAGVVILADICKSSYAKCTTELVSTKTCYERYATVPKHNIYRKWETLADILGVRHREIHWQRHRQY